MPPEFFRKLVPDKIYERKHGPLRLLGTGRAFSEINRLGRFGLKVELHIGRVSPHSFPKTNLLNLTAIKPPFVKNGGQAMAQCTFKLH